MKNLASNPSHEKFDLMSQSNAFTQRKFIASVENKGELQNNQNLGREGLNSRPTTSSETRRKFTIKDLEKV